MNQQPQIDQQITFLYTTDLLETTTFYEDVMGFELVLDQKTCRIYRTSPNAFLGICQRSNIEIDLWYSDTMHWLALQTKTESGRQLRYQLERFPV